MKKAKKGNKYLFKVNAKGKDYTYYVRRTTIDGKHVTITAKDYSSWKLKVEKEIADAKEKAKELDYENITVKEASKLYLKDAENDAPSTYLRKEQYMRNYILPEFGSKKVADIKNSQIRTFYKNVELKSFNLVIECSKVMNTFIQFCIDEEIAIEESPVKEGLMKSISKKKKRIAREKGESVDDIIIDREQISYILKEVQGRKEEIIYHLQILHGLRIGEALAVKFEDIDFDKSLININKQVTSINKKRTKGTRHESEDYNILAPTKTESSIRTIPLVPPTRELLKELIEKDGKDKGYVYKNRNKKVCGKDNWNNRHHNPLMKEMGIEVPTHTLRKFFGSFHISSGTPIQVVSKWLGHSDIATTLKHYAKVIKQDEDDNKWKTAELMGF